MAVKITIDGEYFSEGSLLRGDRKAGVEGLAVEVAVDGDVAPELVARMVREAEAGCFTLGALRNPSPVIIVAKLKGEQLDLSS